VQSYGIKDIELSTGISRHQLRTEIKNLPEPDSFDHHGPHWHEEKFKAIVKKFGNLYEIISLAEVARQLNLQVSSIRNVIKRGAIEKPTVTVGKRRYYRKSDLLRILEQYNTPRKIIPAVKKRFLPPGFYSARSIMKELNISSTTWLYHRYQRRIPDATHLVRGQHAYNESEKAEIISKMRQRWLLKPRLRYPSKK
jgi:hypothetical protein